MNPIPGRRRALGALARLVLPLMLVRSARAQDPDTPAEQQIKAAFLYKFLAFVEWPAASLADPESPIVVGVAGAERIADELAQVVANRNVNGHPVTTRKLRRGESPAGVHLLFIGRDARPSEWLGAARSMPVLVVSESEEAFAQGSTINFVVVDNKVRFDAAPRAAEQSNLKISSRLLAVARKVVEPRSTP